MILVVTGDKLVQLITDMPGWQTISVRSLSNGSYNVHLSKKQVAALGAARIKSTYGHEYKPFQEEENEMR